MLARFGALLEPECQPLRSEPLGQLAEVVTARRTLLRDPTTTTSRTKSLSLDLLKRQATLRLEHIGRQIKAADACAGALLAADPLLARRFAVLTSIPGVGGATAVALIADMPELGRMDAKQAAPLASPEPGAAARARCVAAVPTCARRSACPPWWPCASTRTSAPGSSP